MIAVDLDGTLAQYADWDEGEIGSPIPVMVERVKRWLDQGQDVCIFTARVCNGDPEGHRIRIAIWLNDALGIRYAQQIKKITAEKTWDIHEIWDDRAIGVVPNTGERADGKDG